MRTNDSALGRLMSDFYSQEADNMYYKELSDKVRHYKESEEGGENNVYYMGRDKK